MKFLKSFTLLDELQENSVLMTEKRRIFNISYPLHIFTLKEFKEIEFDDITIFYGGNGSGKSTLINIISEKIQSQRKSPIDKGSYFNEYVNICKYDKWVEYATEIKTITSDDVFDYLLDIRSINLNVNRRKERLSKEYLSKKYSGKTNTFDNYEEIKNSYDAKRQTMSKYVRERLANNNIVEQSNGESALLF